MDALIARYTGIVMARPSEAFPLRRLAELYRQRDGNLDKLVGDLQQQIRGLGSEAWAATVALAGIYRLDQKTQESIRIYREAIRARPGEVGPLRALAETVHDSGDVTEARRLYEQVLGRVTAQVDKEATLRTLIQLALDQKDPSAAKAFHKQLVKLAQGSVFVKAELGRELMQRGHYALAEVEYRELVQAASGDNRALAPALRDLGQALVRLRKNVEAIEVLRRALGVAGQAAGVRREVHALITEAYRAEGRLPELIELLESQRSNDFHEVVTLGLLLEETGRVDEALELYRRALSLDRRHIDTRLKVIHILQAQGKLEEAIKEYEDLIRAVPNNSDFVFELCEILIQRGERARALQLLTRLEQRTRDEDQLARVAEFYERIEESERAMRILQRLAAGGVRDPRYLIDLGDRYYQQGDKEKALETWARLRAVIPNRAEAIATLGDLYLDHDMQSEALQAFREALKLEPNNVRYLKSLAIALERTAAAGSRQRAMTGEYVEALHAWQKVLELATAQRDDPQAREARMHIVTLWSLSRQLSAQVDPLANKFSADPPDIQAGRMLAEVLTRLQRLDDAERTLVRLTALRPGESDIFLTLERVVVLQRKLDEAIKVLKKLAEIDPMRARQYFQRMAQYAAELYRDDDAVAFAAQAVALAPDDAEGHRKLGEMYRRRQDNERAISEFRAAIAKNDRLFLVYFDLAELLLARGDTEEADQLFRRVVRMSPDEEMVARAARLSMQLNLGKGTLEVLERELLPAALGNPQKQVYRRLLVDLYGAMTFPLVQRVRYGTADEAKVARQKLIEVGTRAVKPLLDALADDNQAQQLIAIEVLAFVQNRSAAPALFAFATGQADVGLRTRAMVACGALRDPDLLPRYRSLLRPDDAAPIVLGGAIPVAAAWGVARMQHPKALPLLRDLSKQGTPELRALALLGLGFSADRVSAPLLAGVVESLDAGNVAQAAAALALAELGAKEGVDALVTLSRSPDALPRAAALVALGRLAPDLAKPLAAQAIFDPAPAMRNAAFAAALVASTRRFERPGDPWDVPDAGLDVRQVLDGMVPSNYTQLDRAQTLLAMEKPLQEAAVNAVRTSPERATLLADALLARGNSPALAPFTDGLDELPPALRQQAEAVAQRIAAATTPGFVALVRHPSADLRVRAVRVLANQPSKQARAAVVDALSDRDETVQRAALAVFGDMGSSEAMAAVAAILRTHTDWALRVRAARALGRLPSTNLTTDGYEALARAAREDAYALVRKAAVQALADVARQRA
ncbi:MAG: HEAT repeat domain-containing protein, partial [Polyangiaceae bacterium]|nr:HEAT repeat domain-containing protein [Polyangiaceae bacterium]